MINFFVSRPIAVIISFIALILLGVCAFFFVPTSLVPNVDIPRILIKINAPSKSVGQIESTITSPIRNNLLQLSNIEDIASSSTEGKSTIELKFETGTNISASFVEVNEKVDAAMNFLDGNIVRPKIIKIESANIPLYYLNISKKNNIDLSLSEISNLAKSVIKRRIEQLPEIATVDLTGYSQPQIQLQLKDGYLNNLGVDPSILESAFKENNIELGDILVKDGHYQYYLTFRNDLRNISTIENMPLNIQGRVFKIGDFAEVSLGNSPDEGAFFRNGQRAISLSVIKQQGIGVHAAEQSFSTLLTHLRTDYPKLNFEISQNQAELLSYTISNLQQDLLLGAILGFIMMLIFVRKIRAALLIGITVPFSLAISQLGFFLFHISSNIVSIGGLILGLAMIIDNSIVVIDSINGFREQGFNLHKSTVKGTNEIIRPLTASLLTSCAVFVPFIFIKGLAGAIFYDQAISVIIGVGSSYIVSIGLLPVLYKVIHTKSSGKHDHVEIKAFVNVTNWYEAGLGKVFKFPILTSSIILGLIFTSIVMFFIIKKERLPPITSNDFELKIDWNEDIKFDESSKRMEFLLKQVDKVKESNVWLGVQNYLFQNLDLDYNQCKIYLKLAEADLVRHRQNDIETLILKKYPLAAITFSPARNAFDEIFGDNNAPIILNISNSKRNGIPEIETVRSIINGLKRKLPSIIIPPIRTFNKIIITVDPNLATLYKVDNRSVARELEENLKDRYLASFQDSQSLLPIVITAKEFESVNDIIDQLFIRNVDNINIPLRTLITQTNEEAYKAINAGAQGEFFPIEIYSESPANDLKNINSFFKNNFKDLIIEYKGSYFDNDKLLKEMAVILAISICLLYFILAAQFESLLQPLFVLIELPIALSGAFIFLFIGKNSLNLMSMIGVVVMCGLIINDSILKIDAINQLRKKGTPVKDAILEGGHKRFKPILMITLTSIGSLLPTLFMNDLGSELQKPLALSLIGGMLIGLFVSLFFVPLLYATAYSKK